MKNKLKKYVFLIEQYFEDLNRKNNRFIFMPIFRIDLKIKENIKKLKNKDDVTTLRLYVRNFDSIEDIRFDFYKFDSQKTKILVIIFFEENDEYDLKNFIKFLGNNNFIDFVEYIINRYFYFINILPDNIIPFTNVNTVKNKNMKLIITFTSSLFDLCFTLLDKRKIFDTNNIIVFFEFFNSNQIEYCINSLEGIMNKKLWSISTTLRNPYRFKDFLKVLSELEGKEWNRETQIEFQIRLIQNRLYGLTNQFLKDLPKDLEEKFLDFDKELDFETAKKIFRFKNYTDPSMRGRTSFKPLEKFGAVSVIDGKIKITKLGKWILSDDFDINKFFLKALLKWQYSNPLDRDFKDFNIKPFVGVIELIYKVNKKCKELNLKRKGISFWEFEIFALSLSNYKEIDKKVDELLNFRREFESIASYKEKEKFYKNFKENYLSKFSNKKHSKDYADNALRYFRLTNLLYIRGGGFYIDLDERKLDLIEFIINKIGSYKNDFKNVLDYIEYLSNLNLPKVDFEEKEFFIKSILSLDSSYDINKLKSLNIEELKNIYQDLIVLNKKKLLNIDEVIYNLKNYRKHPTLKPSVALEKYVTEALVIINDALKIKPNYIAGDDGEIIFTAPANKPDIECFYESFNSICEVTSLTSRDQWFNEGQPVMRHLREFENKYNNSYALFIAPKLHQDTINTFWFAVKYEYEGQKQKIIPLTVSQLIEILEVIKISNKLSFSHRILKKFFDEIIDVRDISNSKEWISSIPKRLQKFKEELCS